MTFDLLCFGEAMMELTKLSSGDYKAGFGGDTSNCAIAAARQGARTGYISAVGDDGFGRDLLSLWQAEGVATDFVRIDPAASTGLYIITPSPAGRDFAYYRAGSAASRYTAADLPVDALKRTRIIQLSGISQAIGDGPREAGAALIEAARAAGCHVAYDTNLRLKLWDLDQARATMHAALAGCTIALPSIDDSRMLTGLEDADAIVDAHLAMGPEIVALKMGEAGAIVATRTRRAAIPPHPVTPVDATGAGDTFDGAFLAQLAAGADPVQAGRYAAIAAAMTTTGYGAVAPIPSFERVRAELS